MTRVAVPSDLLVTYPSDSRTYGRNTRMELGRSLNSANTFCLSSPRFYPIVGPAGMVMEMVEVEVEVEVGMVEVGMVAPAGMVAVGMGVVGMVVAVVEMVEDEEILQPLTFLQI